MVESEEIKHERELRLQWEDAHMAVHRAEAYALKIARDGDLKALDIASNEINRRLMDMNEIRSQINSERGLYLTREVYDEQHNSLRDQMDVRLKLLEQVKSNMEGRLWMMGAAVSVVVVAVNAVLYYLGHK